MQPATRFTRRGFPGRTKTVNPQTSATRDPETVLHCFKVQDSRDAGLQSSSPLGRMGTYKAFGANVPTYAAFRNETVDLSSLEASEMPTQ
jgi:hypothetical protein